MILYTMLYRMNRSIHFLTEFVGRPLIPFLTNYVPKNTRTNMLLSSPISKNDKCNIVEIFNKTSEIENVSIILSSTCNMV